jgi:hypothetical protein
VLLEHEFVEVHAALLLDRRGFKKQIEQQRLAAPDRPPKIKPPRRLAPLPARRPASSAQAPGQRIQALGGAPPGRDRAQIARGQALAVRGQAAMTSLQNSGGIARPKKPARAGSSKPWTALFRGRRMLPCREHRRVGGALGRSLDDAIGRRRDDPRAQPFAPAKHIVDVLIEERAPKLSSSPIWPLRCGPLLYTRAELRQGRAHGRHDRADGAGAMRWNRSRNCFR